MKNQRKFDKVSCSLMQAEIYARNSQLCKSCSNYGKKQYEELQTLVMPNGVIQERVLVDYPITPDYVKSFAQSADYHNDPATAMAMPPRGKNLGDITGLQEVLSKDMESARTLYSNLKAVFEKAQTALDTAQVQTKTETEENNG